MMCVVAAVAVEQCRMVETLLLTMLKRLGVRVKVRVSGVINN
jgi:hypothetical protein